MVVQLAGELVVVPFDSAGRSVVLGADESDVPDPAVVALPELIGLAADVVDAAGSEVTASGELLTGPVVVVVGAAVLLSPS